MDYLISGIEFLQKGGLVMYLLLACSFVVMVICIERGLYFRQHDTRRSFAADLYHLTLENKFSEAWKLLAGEAGVLPQILQAGLERKEKNNKSLTAFFEMQSGIALSHFRQRLNYLSVIVTLAPLLGLLGTISGMISSFSVFNLSSGQTMAITGGVGEALIATAAGLCVAILSLVIHAYFSQRLELIVTDMEECFSLLEDNAAEFLQAKGMEEKRK